MPESKSRKKPTSPKPAAVTVPKEDAPNPVWYVPIFVGLMVLGLVWVVVTYVTDGRLPIAPLGSWNLAVGFGFILVGFGMTMRWR